MCKTCVMLYYNSEASAMQWQYVYVLTSASYYKNSFFKNEFL